MVVLFWSPAAYLAGNSDTDEDVDIPGTGSMKQDDFDFYD